MRSFAAIDFETATASRASACALGLVLIDDGVVTGEHRYFIRPPSNEYHGLNISVHGITPEQTANAPDFPEVWSAVDKLIGERVTVAHHAAFDFSVARTAAHHWGYTCPERDFACTYRLAKRTWPDRWTYRLDRLAAELGIDLDHHEPLSDARAAAHLAAWLCDYHGATSLIDLAERTQCALGRLTSSGPFTPSTRSPSLAQLAATVDEFDEGHSLYGARVAFTGTLDVMTRTEAAQFVLDVGAVPTDSVSKTLNYLVVGLTRFGVVGSDGMSSKLRKAVTLAEEGHDLEIIDEREFLRLLNM